MSTDSGSAVIEKQSAGREDRPVELPRRVLGKTGERVPILGFGTAPGGMGLSDEDAIALIHRAIDLGVTYVDTAPGYGRAHVQVGEVMAQRRDEVFLVTKAPADDGKKALENLEQSLVDLQTDQLDLVYVHSLGNRDVDRVLAPDGSLAALREAQRRGWTRYVGFTAHNVPGKAVRALREAEVDVVMLAMNLVDRHTYNFEEEVLPVARERGVGVAAMKVYGGAPAMKYDRPTHSELSEHGPHDHRSALRYALDLPGVATAVVGMFSETELMQNIEWAQNHSPLATDEAAGLEKLGKEIAADWGPHFGSVT
jgi:predicted aldo/keto reductase-like oxidoreductase